MTGGVATVRRSRTVNGQMLVFNDIFSVCGPKITKLCTAHPQTIGKMNTKFEVDRVSGSRVMRGTDEQTDTQTDVPCINR